MLDREERVADCFTGSSYALATTERRDRMVEMDPMGPPHGARGGRSGRRLLARAHGETSSGCCVASSSSLAHREDVGPA